MRRNNDFLSRRIYFFLYFFRLFFCTFGKFRLNIIIDADLFTQYIIVDILILLGYKVKNRLVLNLIAQAWNGSDKHVLGIANFLTN